LDAPFDSHRRPTVMNEDELAEWLESIDDILHRYGPEQVQRLLSIIGNRAAEAGIAPSFELNTPYINTIHVSKEPRYPGSWEIEKRIKSIIRWNAMAMVLRANRQHEGIGGHISTYASAATLYEVGFNHFFRARSEHQTGDFVYFQGHSAPGIYARAFVEGRLNETDLLHFRLEARAERGLPSYPHPRLMPSFWQFPTVSMGLGPVMAIYQARFNRYLHDRGIKDTSNTKVWCFVGDGESDEPETLGAISLAARERLDNLIFVVNCNLQRLDGPVRGNGKIIQELETVFRGAGWNVIKVIWGGDWDPLLARDDEGLLVDKMNRTVDGQFQRHSAIEGAYDRQAFFGENPKLLKMVEHLTDDQIHRLTRGGHDSRKVYAAFKAAVEHTGSPTVVLAKTIKGYGLGEAGEGRNITHQQKKLNDDELRAFRSRFGIPVSDEQLHAAPFYRPSEESLEMRYLRERRDTLGGYLPTGKAAAPSLEVPERSFFAEFFTGSAEHEVATTMAFVRMLRRLLRDKQIGPRIVPIIPDEARTFGMDALFRQHGIYSSVGQVYEPVDSESLLYYREAKDGQILEEGITETGATSSFIAAGTSYATQGINMVPFYSFYSMFGFQRVGDLIWAAADMGARGFLMGGTAGRTTLAGEGLQHQDGHSHILAATVPSVKCYDPAFAYELAIILQDGLRRMVQLQEDWIYYITMYNETYPMPAKPDGVEDGILNGLYRYQTKDAERARGRVQLLGSGPILREVIRAQEILVDRYQISSDVWSVTSYKALRQDALAAEHWNLHHPGHDPKQSFLEQTLSKVDGPFVAATDYMKLVPDQIARWIPGLYWVLGTDGFGRSDTRDALRRYFEINAEMIAFTALRALNAEGKLDRQELLTAQKTLAIDLDKADPLLL